MPSGVRSTVLPTTLSTWPTVPGSRWVLPGATSCQLAGSTRGLPRNLFRVESRYQAGLIEDRLREHIADKTHWQKMLKGNAADVDLPTLRDELMARSEPELELLEQEFGLQALQRLYTENTTQIEFPVSVWPEKVKSFNLDKQPLIEGLLQGIKGQYLIFDSGVINIRKYTAYNVQLSVYSL